MVVGALVAVGLPSRRSSFSLLHTWCTRPPLLRPCFINAYCARTTWENSYREMTFSQSRLPPPRSEDYCLISTSCICPRNALFVSVLRTCSVDANRLHNNFFNGVISVLCVFRLLVTTSQLRVSSTIRCRPSGSANDGCHSPRFVPVFEFVHGCSCSPDGTEGAVHEPR